ncbi:orotidine 5'-phosphate decarboxylase [Knoellia flava TL1]|uniref:Orotidine 5'-phosphate decarboxylase n=2 Tax=Knoellia flava TaxID=913969 RepID=A0A8H9KRA0_9MICO|nr:orotidine-5'-phosphate decarboxylase [Knoellia flava]KGN31556.1 orotidine 5'-phosphate decarboxylase [Knoellia flava TL1]GGB68048.1 orotidine 5'-phosphate decarboxylase [Knoellia flava]
MSTTPTFGQRLREATGRLGPLCAGIDPHRALVESWGLAYDLDGLRAFTRACVEAFGGHVAVVKPQSAFFEVFGSAGVAVLEEAVRDLRAAGTLVLVDAKRGDIGTTMDAYAEAFLGKDAVDAPDAVTVSPYLGYGSLRPAIDLAEQTGRGVFVLALTSNPEGPEVQHAVRDGRSVAGTVVAGATADNATAAARGELGHVGLVVGATVGTAVQDLGLDLAAVNGALLAPGVGAQGGTAEDLKRVFGDALSNVLPASSREVLGAGPDVVALRDRAARTSEAMAALLS